MGVEIEGDGRRREKVGLVVRQRGRHGVEIEGDRMNEGEKREMGVGERKQLWEQKMGKGE